MKIAIFGAGAIGAYLGVRLHQAGAAVTLIARGPNLAAIRENGVTLKSADETVTVRPFCTDNPKEAGIQDCVFIALKAHVLPSATQEIAALVGDNTTIVTAMNGVPYWYFYGWDSPWRDRIIQSVDPGGRLWRTLPPHHVIGSVLYPWAELVAPGVVEQSTSNRFILGEPDGSESARIKSLSAIMTRGKLDAPITRDIRADLWTKLWGNLSMNPLSALTGATIDRLAFEPGLRAVGRAMMVEAEAVANALGIRFRMDVEARIDLAGSAGARKTSMLQDLERGRTLELDPLLTAVIELGELTGHPLPLCRSILALTRERERNMLSAGPGDGRSSI
jgi:2-dehydropantoate 2-reductase